MEKKLVCPNCGEPFEIDEKGYAAIAKQVRDREFKEELTRQQASLEAEKKTALELAKSQTAESYEKQLAAKETEILKLKAQGEQAGKQQELAVARAEAVLKEQMQERIQRQQDEIAELKAQAELTRKQAELAEKQTALQEKNLRESLATQLKQQRESYDMQMKQQQESYGMQLKQQQASMTELKERYEAQLRQQEQAMKERYEAERRLEEKAVKENYGDQIKELFGQEVIVPTTPFPVVKLADLYKGLEEEFGYTVDESEKGDLTTEAERLSYDWVKKHYGHEFLFITDYSAEKRAFYHMRDENGVPQGYDLIWRGVEITTGAQREHRYDVLKKQAEEKGLADDVKFYLEFFQYGCPPHGGFGLGIDRLTMLLCGQSIKDAEFLFRGPNRLTP